MLVIGRSTFQNKISSKLIWYSNMPNKGNLTSLLQLQGCWFLILHNCKNYKYIISFIIIYHILSLRYFQVFLKMENIFVEKTLWLHISGNATNAMFPCSCAVNVNILDKTIFASYSEHVKITNTQRSGWWGQLTTNKTEKLIKVFQEISAEKTFDDSGYDAATIWRSVR